MKREFAALGFLIVVCAAISAASPRFLGPSGIDLVLQWMPIITILALGQFLVLLTGGIDVSVGSNLGLTALAVGLLMVGQPNLPVPVYFLAAGLVGAVLGSVNGLLAAWARVPPLIVTIATLSAFRGFAFLLSHGDQLESNEIPDGLKALAREGISLGGVTAAWLLVISLVLALLVWGFVRLVSAGRALYAVGSSHEAAHLRGLPTRKIEFMAYTLCGAFAGLAAMAYAARFGVVNPASAGANMELNSIAAAAIGGVALAGGSGSAGGVLLGCLILACVNVGLSVLGIDANWQLLVYGVVILLAVITDGLLARRRA